MCRTSSIAQHRSRRRRARAACRAICRSRPIISRIIASWLICRAVELADRCAVAQHHDAVGALLDLVEPVRDEDDRDAARLEVGDRPRSSRSVSVSVRLRGRLVHDDDARVERQRLGDLHHLPLRDRQIGDRRVGREVDAEPVQQRRDARAQRLAVDQPQRPAPARLAADEDIGGDVEIVEQVEFLMDEGDAGGESPA